MIRSRTPRVEVVAAVLAASALAGVASAAPAARSAPPKALQAVIDCRKIDDGARRLACYDAAVGVMESAEKSGDIVSLDREQRRAARRQSFGFTLPTLAFLDTGEKPAEMNRVEETLADASQDTWGKWTFHMQDGAVWRQIDDELLSRKPHPGSAIVIQRAMLGSYMLSVDGQPAVRAHRDN